MKRIISAFILLTVSLSSNAMEMNEIPQLELTNFPLESDCVNLDPYNRIIKETLDKAINDAQNGIIEGCSRVPYVTPSEGKKYFSDYLIDKIERDEAERIAPFFFTDTYFGVRFSSESKRETSQEIASHDPYLFTHINNILLFGSPGRERTMEVAKTRWHLKTNFLTPREVFEAYCKSNVGRRHMKVTDFDEYKQVNPTHMETIFSSKYFGIPESDNEKIRYFLTHSLSFFTQELVESIYRGALKIMRNSVSGDNIVIFGNTPYFIGRALTFLISREPGTQNHRTIIEFPFSGAPNRVRQNNFPNPNDFVTPERLEHLKARLRNVGLTVENLNLLKQKTHFVDVIASGSGVAFVIEELLRDFYKAGLTTPPLDIFILNKIDIDNQDDTRNALITERNADDGEQVTFSFPSIEETHFKIQGRVVYVPGHKSLDNLPSNQWRVFPQYNASFWQDEYDLLLQRELPHHINVLFEFFDTNIQHLMDNDLKVSIA